jgi:hypothetical protein
VSRQLRQGHVSGPIYCFDVSQCYLLSLATTPLPLLFTQTLHKPAIPELVDDLANGTGCALVQINSPEQPYPVRRAGRVRWATGQFWTWLAGAELARALLYSQVAACQTAYLWSASRMASARAQELLSITESLKAQGLTLAACGWRALYCQLVGRFAGWRKIWRDTTSQQQFGRWAAWLEAEPETGRLVQYRAIAGKVQRLADRSDTSDSVPLLFGAVTAQSRYIVSRACDLAGHGEVVAIEADAIWVTRAGWQALQRSCSQVGVAPDYLQTKEIFDQAWMTGKAIAVVEQRGKRYLRCPGVPADIAVGDSGHVSWPQAEPWAKDGSASPKRGIRRLERRYSAKEIVKLYAEPARTLSYAEELIDPMLSDELLEPVGGRRKTPEDDA